MYVIDYNNSEKMILEKEDIQIGEIYKSEKKLFSSFNRRKRK